MVFVVNAFFQIPSSPLREKRKEVENEEKNIDGMQKKLKRKNEKSEFLTF